MNLLQNYKTGALLLALTLFAATSLKANTIVVNTSNDELNQDGDCSLREALVSANRDTAIDACVLGSGDDVIMLSAGHYELSITGAEEDHSETGDLDVRDNVRIIGLADDTTIDGNDIDRVFHVLNAEMSIENLSIEHGRALNGGGLKCEDGGRLEVTNTRLWLNHADEDGGGIYCRDGLVMLNSMVYSNTAGNNGGGIWAYYLSIRESLFSYNAAGRNGGGISASDGNVYDSVIEHNSSGNGGGGISAAYVGILNSTINHNLADFGGGVFGVDIALTRSTVSNNTARLDGGGVSFGSEGWITESTLSGNIALRHGGGYNGACHNGCFITASTIANNNAGIFGNGIYNTQQTRLQKTLVAQNGTENCVGNIISQGYNLDNDNSCELIASTDLSGVDNALISPLQDNGGLTKTHALLIGSPAIEAGGITSCRLTDQRGVSRPAKGNDSPGEARCDIGAYEVSADLNGDGCVDRATDFALIIDDIRSYGPHNRYYDLNGDGKINIADARVLVTLFTNYRGQSCS